MAVGRGNVAALSTSPSTGGNEPTQVVAAPSRARALAVDTVVAVGRPAVTFIEEVGSLGLFCLDVAFWLPRRPFRWGQLARHMRDVGFGSLFIVMLTGLFTGLSFGFQSLQGFRRFGAEALVGPTTMLGLVRELGPVLTGLMVAGRSGSGMATELGTMRVTEQIDALSTLAVEPVQYLVVPRAIATTLMMPLLTIVFCAAGYGGCYVMAVMREGVDPGVFFYETWQALDPDDFYEGWIKGAIFGLQIALIASYQGFHASGGARGVGEAATRTVVISNVCVLVSTYLLAEILDPLIHSWIRFDALPK
ncbi:MAG: ABC transporter permease [Deltaproteobacteria bacterium]|nr:ABC transporter permease [Deltaproteobacteria bacterium]